MIIAILLFQTQASFDTETNLKTIHTSFVKEMNQFEQSNAMWDLCIDSVICATCANRTINMESWNSLKIVFDISKLAQQWLELFFEASAKESKIRQ